MPKHRRARRFVVVALAAGLVLLLVGCQMNVTVDTVVNDDGSGTVTIGLGLDDKALTRAGNLDATLHVDDLKTVGWQITPAAKLDDGFTWVHASHPFANPDELASLMRQFSGGAGAFRDFELTKDDGLTSTTWNLTGTVDLTPGLDQFGDSELADALGGDRFGGNVEAIQREEGKPATQMMALDLSVKVPGADKQDFRPTFADPKPTQIDVKGVVAKPVGPIPLPTDGGSLVVYVVVAVALIGAVVMLFVLRRRFTAAR
jgi:hypothetical protein